MSAGVEVDGGLGGPRLMACCKDMHILGMIPSQGSGTGRPARGYLRTITPCQGNVCLFVDKPG